MPQGITGSNPVPSALRQAQCFALKFEAYESEKINSRQEAVNRESQIKGWSFAKKKALIDGNKELLIKLSKSTGIGEARNDNGK